jgi:hypothetical protein
VGRVEARAVLRVVGVRVARTASAVLGEVMSYTTVVSRRCRWRRLKDTTATADGSMSSTLEMAARKPVWKVVVEVWVEERPPRAVCRRVTYKGTPLVLLLPLLLPLLLLLPVPMLGPGVGVGVGR